MFFIDYLQITLKEDTDNLRFVVKEFFKFFPLEIEEFDIIKSMFGYTKVIKFPCGVTICFDGLPGMGIFIQISGSALSSSHFDNFNIFETIDKLKKYNVDYSISRVDVAIDIEKDFKWFYDKYIQGLFVSRYRSYKSYLDQNNRGTLYFGKRGNNTFFRIYDKGLEQNVDFNWVRIEMECRGKDSCEQLLEAMKEGNVNCVFMGHLRVVEKIEKNLSRMKTDKEWMEMLNNPKERIKVKRLEKDSTLFWLENQVAPTLKALILEYGNEFIEKIINESKVSKNQIRKRNKLKVIKCRNNVIIEQKEYTKEYIQILLRDCI